MVRPLEIYFIDNAARADVFSNIASELDGAGWKYGVMPPASSVYEVEDTNNFWYYDMNSNRWQQVLFEDILDKLETIAPETKDYRFKIIDCKAGGKTYGLDGQIHVDKEFDFNVEGDGYMTICYFPNKEWDPEWGGELQFFDREGNILASYYPRPNTCLVFDSNIPHRGLAPNRTCDKLRKYVSFKCFVHKNWKTE